MFHVIVRHLKDGLSEILSFSKNSNEGHQKVVVYKSLQKSDYPVGKIWGKIMTEFNTIGRFKVIDKDK